MITHSLKSSNNLNYPKKKSNKRNYNNNYIPSNSSSHTSPSFDCCCFDCFSHFWNLWDSSPHSELIHQAIEAFEEHLSSTEIKKKNNKNNKSSHNSSSKRRENNNHNNNKMVCSTAAADVEERDSLSGSTLVPVQEVVGDDVEVVSVVLDDVEERENEVEEECSPVAGDGEEEERESGTQKKMLQQQQHKGLARKVLPDFIGLFHSRLWNLWGPNV